MTQPGSSQPDWQVRVVQPLAPWKSGPIRPAEVGRALCETMLLPSNLLEDARYHKIVPNRFIVELSEENYQRNYQPIQAQLLQQWSDRLLEYLTTANSRQGRREFRFGGRVEIEIRPSASLKTNQARLLTRIDANDAQATSGERSPLPACLYLLPFRQQLPLFQGITTIGRETVCDIQLSNPEIQEKRLVSGQHAYVVFDRGRYTLYDGAPDGRPSLNGTYVNNARVGVGGRPLADGDTIILAAVKPDAPRPDTPGVAVFQFSANCQASISARDAGASSTSEGLAK